MNDREQLTEHISLRAHFKVLGFGAALWIEEPYWNDATDVSLFLLNYFRLAPVSVKGVKYSENFGYLMIYS